MKIIKRCGWVNMKSPIYIEYHDTEWGRPVHNDQKLFELICLEGAQAGLSWEIILNKREEYRKCFWNFNVVTILKKTDQELLERMSKYGIVKNKLKVLSIKKNAIAYQRVIDDHSSLDQYLWSFVGGKPIINKWKIYKDIPNQNDISIEMSKALKKYGFTFVGPTICYAFMQAAGLVNDHQKDCPYMIQ